MSEPFLGEIRPFAFPVPPRGWTACNGQLLPINQNQALYSLLGTQYGGDGTTTFALPNLQGRLSVHRSASIPQGSAGGEESHQLTTNEIPAHTHNATASSATANQAVPTDAFWADGGKAIYAATGNATLAPTAIAMAGGNQSHPNWSPHLVVNFCMATSTGIYPSHP